MLAAWHLVGEQLEVSFEGGEALVLGDGVDECPQQSRLAGTLLTGDHDGESGLDCGVEELGDFGGHQAEVNKVTQADLGHQVLADHH
ncbi:Uncharacterised protein [Mycobacteroides abscessus subsp. abscessus]|nr:Uncharacterised protein [Mycobacteroides abscessus subsp. abscessus]